MTRDVSIFHFGAVSTPLLLMAAVVGVSLCFRKRIARFLRNISEKIRLSGYEKEWKKMKEAYDKE